MSLLLAGGIIGAVGSIYSGISAMNSANQTAADMRRQGDVLFAESLRTAAIIEEEGEKFGAMQSLQYIGSGVELGGSALITIAQTKKYAATEAAATRSSGKAKRDLSYSGAQRTENEGRAKMIGGIIGGASRIFNALGATTSAPTVEEVESSNDVMAFPEGPTPGSVPWFRGSQWAR